MPINEVGTEQCNLWVWGHSHFWLQTKKKVTGPDQVLDSYVSLCNNFADRVRSTVVSHKKNVCAPKIVSCKRNLPNLVLCPLFVLPVV